MADYWPARADSSSAIFQHGSAAGVESIAVNSATAGLHLALEAVGVVAGDEVITSTHTCYSER
jgi:hypothetical protein